MSDGVVLTGMPGSGKTVIGRRVAAALGRQFIDIDAEIESTTGRSPADHISTDGEQAFRAIEREAVAAACTVPGAVIAAGGGAPLDPLNRWAFMEHGLRVGLDVGPDQLAFRLGSDPVSRPLLGDDLRAGLQRTAEHRAPVYRAVDVVVDASGDPEATADEVATASRRAGLGGTWRPLYDAHYGRHHPVGPERGRLLMGSGIDRESFEDSLKAFEGHAPVAVADRRALDAHPSLTSVLPARMCAFDGGEEAKGFGKLEELLTWLTDLGAERGDPLVVCGGGTMGDVGGLAAALYRRGMPLVQLPTTWLAQADSALGGKVAIDLPNAKNGVGAIWPAWLIVSDIGLLGSLPEGRRRDGLAECLKAGLIGDPELWRLVEERGPGALAGTDPAATYAMTERAARLKLAIVEHDPYETGARRTLNLGHTIGHALEVESGYTLAHGEAVALGLRAVAVIAGGRGAEPGLGERIDDVLNALGFPLRRRFDEAVLVKALSTDKKRERGALRWILPMDVGRVEEVADVTPEELAGALRAIPA